MAPKLFTKFFKRRKKESKFKLRDCSPNAIGISDSTCEINGDIFNRWKLPIQPEQGLCKLGARKRSSQQQCSFFRLPAEIRRLVYIELMGGRRVHIRYFWMEPLPSWPQSKRGGPRWHWWHRVCMECDDFINDPCDDPCSHWYPESQRLTIGGEWLRCCQIGYEEALDVLYGTNNFVMDNAMDTPFLISRILAPRCASFMTSMEISFAVNICKAGPDEDDWMRTYAAFFGLFEQSFRGVHRLRLQLKMPPSEIGEIFFDDERLRTFLKPFDRLSKGREWTRLQLCVPDYYFQRIKQIKPGQDRWELTDTMWGDQSLYPVCLAFGL